MQEGDSVMVQASRDKQRGGVIEKIYDDGTCIVNYGEGSSSRINITDIVTKGIKKQTATKYDGEKVRMELIPASAIEALGRAMTYGSKKYDDHNWANGFEWDRLVGSLLRHVNAWRAGQDLDPESGLSHIDHVMANAAMLAAHIEEGLGNDNRRKTIS